MKIWGSVTKPGKFAYNSENSLRQPETWVSKNWCRGGARPICPLVSSHSLCRLRPYIGYIFNKYCICVENLTIQRPLIVLPRAPDSPSHCTSSKLLYTYYYIRIVVLRVRGFNSRSSKPRPSLYWPYKVSHKLLRWCFSSFDINNRTVPCSVHRTSYSRHLVAFYGGIALALYCTSTSTIDLNRLLEWIVSLSITGTCAL